MKRCVSFILIFSVCLSMSLFPVAFADSSVNQHNYYRCPSCGTFSKVAYVSANPHCPTCGSFLVLMGGGQTYGGGAGARGRDHNLEIPIQYYTKKPKVQGGPDDGDSGGSDDGGTVTGVPGPSTTTNYLNYSYTTGDILTYTAINKTTNTWYNPITNTYNTYNNITYNNEYNYYNITNNEYNTYITNNYTYVTYYIQNLDGDGDVSSEDFVQVYYRLPDGRNSIDLKAEDVWGQYFVYDVYNYDEVVEDDGTTLGLWHLDGDLLNSAAGNGGYLQTLYLNFVDSNNAFGSGLYMPTGNSSFFRGVTFSADTLSILSGLSSWTLEFHAFSNGGHLLFGPSLGDLVGSYNSYNYASSDNIASLPISFSFESSGFPAWYAVQCDNGVLSFYCSGMPCVIPQFKYHDDSYNSYRYDLCLGNLLASSVSLWGRGDLYVDEIRLSRGALYPSSGYSPTQAPFDTNSVLVTPENPSEYDIIVKSNVPVNSYRIGGVRPTYPTMGNVYVYLEDNVVKSVQQYQADGWHEVDAAIYISGQWQNILQYDMSPCQVQDPDDTGGGSGGGSGDSGGGGSGDSGGGSGGGSSDTDKDGLLDKLFGALGDLLGSFLDGVIDLATLLVEKATSLLASITELFTSLVDSGNSFAEFISVWFHWLPAEVVSIMALSVGLMVVLALIRFFWK